MRPLANADPIICSCKVANSPAANWCARCGKALETAPDLLAWDRWRPARGTPPPTFDVSRRQLGAETPRLWLSGGCGAWYVSEDQAGRARSRIVDCDAADRGAGIDLGAFRDLSAIVAGRRGLIAVEGDALRAVARAPSKPWDWWARAQDVPAPAGVLAGLAAATLGQTYALSIVDQRLHLWAGSPLGAWRSLASAPAGPFRGGWIEMAAGPRGDALGWGGGIAACFVAEEARLTVRALEGVADLPVKLAKRVAARPPGDWRHWDTALPVLTGLAGGGYAMLGWRRGGPVLQRFAQPFGDSATVVAAAGALFVRTPLSVKRYTLGEDMTSASPMEIAAPQMDDPRGFPWENGVAFVSVREGRLMMEIVDRRDPLPHPRDTFEVGAVPGMQLAGDGFEPLAIGGRGVGGVEKSELWLAFEAALTRGAPPLHRVLRLQTGARA